MEESLSVMNGALVIYLQKFALHPLPLFILIIRPGEYAVSLKTTDNQGVVDKKEIKLYIKSLAADIQINPKEGNVNTEFTFKGIRSRSDDGTIKKYEWQIQDMEGRTVKESIEEQFSYQFDRPGEYKIFLVVTDTTGAQDKHFKGS